MKSTRGSSNYNHFCPDCGGRVFWSPYFMEYECSKGNCQYTHPKDTVNIDETVEQILEAVIHILKNIETTEEQTRHLKLLESVWNKLGSNWK